MIVSLSLGWEPNWFSKTVTVNFERVFGQFCMPVSMKKELKNGINIGVII